MGQADPERAVSDADAVFNLHNIWWPLRVALAFQVSADLAFARRAQSDRRFDAPDYLVRLLCHELAQAGAIIERKEFGLPRRATICADPPRRFAPFAAANFKGIKSSTEFKLSDLHKDILALCSTVCSQACVHIANGRLRAQGVPIDNGVEGDARSIQPTAITENMTLDKASGVLRQGPTRAWMLVRVRWDDWVSSFSDTEAVRSVAAHISQLASPPSQQLPSLREPGGQTGVMRSEPAGPALLPRGMDNILQAIRAECKERQQTRWIESRPRERDSAIWSQLHRLGYEKAGKCGNPQSFQRRCRLFFQNHWSGVRAGVEAEIPDKSG